MRNRELNVATIVRADVLTDRLQHPLATGNWVGGRTGVSQLLDRNDYISTLSHLRRVISPLSRAQPHFEARDLHATQWGRLCPSETPEGPNCGLVKNFAEMVELSTGIEETEGIKKILYDLNVERLIVKVPGIPARIKEILLDEFGEEIVEELEEIPEVDSKYKDDEFYDYSDSDYVGSNFGD
jgi:DNA-directed RNA polymerase subunit B"